MEALRIENVSKNYDGFKLDNISLSLPCGSIMGFIGENGAGKTTTMKAMLNIIKKDSGKVYILGKEYDEKNTELKEHIGVVMDSVCFGDELNATDINRILKRMYKTWDEKKFFEWMDKFQLDKKKVVREYSRGMTMKLSLAVALSHDTKLLILDEATSGLDPVIRDQMLDVFLEFIQDENNSIFMSSHILSDLEKVCDYITFIHHGKIRFSMEKDELLHAYEIVKCSETELENVETDAIVSIRKNAFGVSALVKKESVPRGMVTQKVNMDDIMLYFVQEEA